MNILSVVVPVFNEQESISKTIDRLLVLKKDLFIKETELELIFIDDGSNDDSLNILKDKSQSHPEIKIISFTRNFGHQIAISAGIDFTSGDYVAIIDADLQDPPEIIIEMYEKALQGHDIVNAKRRSRAGETFFKKTTANLFYKFINYLSETDIPLNVGDFKIISKKVVSSIHTMREKHRFLRGMIPWTGFKEISIEYDRKERFAGKTKYPLKKMIQFAFIAVLSFSSKPLTIAIRLGIIVTMLGFLGGIYVLYQKLFSGQPVPGITSILLTIIIFSGLQITLIGLAGEYIARIFEEVKGRPLYIIEEKVNI